jgi:hypothetical protein
MKKLLIVFCCAFTAVTLFCSFNATRKEGPYFRNFATSSYGVDKITCDGKNYIVVTSDHGVAICPESK